MERILLDASFSVHITDLHIGTFSTSGMIKRILPRYKAFFWLRTYKMSKNHFTWYIYTIGNFGLDIRKCCLRNQLQKPQMVENIDYSDDIQCFSLGVERCCYLHDYGQASSEVWRSWLVHSQGGKVVQEVCLGICRYHATLYFGNLSIKYLHKLSRNWLRKFNKNIRLKSWQKFLF